MSSRLSILLRPIVLLAALAVASSGATASELRVTAQHGGYVEHALVVGEFAYVAQGSSIVTLRLGDSSRPMGIASVSEPLGGLVRAVAVHRNRLYAASGDFFTENAALSIFSLADPARPDLLGHLDASGIFPFTPEGLAVMGDVLYLLSSGDLVPIDLEDPDHPVVGLPVDAPFMARLTPYDRDHLIAWGATLLPSQPGTLIFDVSAPMAPVKVGEILTSFHFDLDVGDGYLVSSGPRFRVFDLSHPAAPTQVAWRDGFDGRAGELVGDHYLVPDGDSLRVWSLGDLGNPVEVANVPSPVAEARWAFHGNGRALVFTGPGRVVEFDVVDPTDPVPTSNLDLPVGPAPFALAQVGSGVDIGFYVADWYRGLQLIDAKLRTVADLGSEWPSVKGLAVEGQRALIADEFSGVHYVDVSDPTAPVPLGTIPLEEARSVEIDGERGWATAAGPSSRQLVTLDLSNPDDPQIVHSSPLGGFSKLLHVSDLLYVADDSSAGGLRIFDVSGAVPVQLGRHSGCWPKDVDVFGSIAALPCPADRLQLVDVSDPADPRLLGTYRPNDIFVLVESVRFADDGRHVYFGMYNTIDVVDVSDPSQPARAHRLNVGSFVDRLETDTKRRLWAATWSGGLARIDEVGPVFGSLAKPAIRFTNTDGESER